MYLLCRTMRYGFDGFVLDLRRRELRRGQAVVPLEAKAFDLLALLVENHDRMVARDEAFDNVWPGVFVTDASLATAVSQLRKALGDSGSQQRFIKTVRGRGLRFVMELEAAGPEPTGPAVKTAEESTEHSTRGPETSGPPVIAVLPFGLIGTDDTHRAIAEAVPTELIGTLTQMKGVRVVARGSSFRFSASDFALQDIRDQLGATYVLAGTVELYRHQLSIRTELTDLRAGHMVWAEAFDGDLEDVFDLRARIAREIAGLLEYRLASHEAEMLARTPSQSLDAWGNYHLGVRAMYRYQAQDNERAKQHFERALTIDPGFARAHAAMSYTSFQSYYQQFGPQFEHHRQATLAYAEEATKLDPFDPYSNLMMGRAKWIAGDISDGASWVERSLQLAPNYSFSYYNSALLNAVLCRGELAESHVASAMVRSPLDPHMQTMMGTRALAGFVRDDEVPALASAEKAMRATNAHPHVYILSAGIFEHYGKTEKAQSALKGLEAWNVGIEDSGFHTHFRLCDQERQTALQSALDRIA